MKTIEGKTPRDAPSRAPTPAPEIIAATSWLKMVGLKIFHAVKTKAKKKPKDRYQTSIGTKRSKTNHDDVKMTSASKILMIDFLILMIIKITAVETIM